MTCGTIPRSVQMPAHSNVGTHKRCDVANQIAQEALIEDVDQQRDQHLPVSLLTVHVGR